MTRYTPKPKLKKYNQAPSDTYEESYCQNAACPNGNLIKKGELVTKKFMKFCSQNCLKEIEKRVLIV